MTESLVETYTRLKKNIVEAKAKAEEDPSIKNKEWLSLMTRAYYDFCATFTENMMCAVCQTIDEVKFM